MQQDRCGANWGKDHRGPYGLGCTFVVHRIKSMLGMVSQGNEAIFLHYSELVRLHLECCAQLCAPKHWKRSEVSVEGHQDSVGYDVWKRG